MQRSILTFAVFVLIFSAILGAAHYYAWSRLVRATSLSPSLHRAGTIAIVAAGLLVPIGLFAGQFLPRRAETALSMLVYGWIGVIMLLVVALGVSELLRAGLSLASSYSQSSMNPERRTFLSRAIAASAATFSLALSGLGTANALSEVSIRSQPIRLRRFPAALSGFRIVQLTDVHIGPTLGREWLDTIVERVNALNADLIVITGDLVDGSVQALRDHVSPLKNLRSKHGTYFVTGNHEYYSGADEWIEELTAMGIRVLRNERVTIGEGELCFDLAGVDDYSAKGFGNGHGADLERALSKRDPAREVVLLAHQPKQIFEAARMDVGLMLSGHTHGGQLFPWMFLVMLDQPYIAGLSTHGATQIYVSRGTGYWGPPMRVGAPAEISLLELHADGPRSS